MNLAAGLCGFLWGDVGRCGAMWVDCGLWVVGCGVDMNSNISSFFVN